MSFEDMELGNALSQALKDLEIDTPTPIQMASYKVIRSGKDVVGVAQTGTGKTFAYLLPILRQLKYSKERVPQVLILAPTRELVIQISKEVEKLSKYLSLRSHAIYGGINIKTQAKELQEGMDILVSTPRRLFDLVMMQAIKLKQIKQLVIDEVDEMMNLGFKTQLESILDLLPKKRQNILYSATLSPEIDRIITDFFDYPEKIEIVPHGTPLELIEQNAYWIPNFYSKINLLNHLLDSDFSMEKILVFGRSKRIVDLIHENIDGSHKEKTEVIHSNKSQNRRMNAVKGFENGEISILIATDIIARGIDITDVTHVINFDLPEEPVFYIHRIGRTGRADKPGKAISFINEEEQDMQMRIEHLMKKRITLTEVPKEVEISKRLLEEEKIQLAGDKPYLPEVDLKQSKGAFHEKLDKNKKVNLGGSYRRKLKEKYKKPIKRSGKKR